MGSAVRVLWFVAASVAAAQRCLAAVAGDVAARSQHSVPASARRGGALRHATGRRVAGNQRYAEVVRASECFHSGSKVACPFTISVRLLL